jgi:hypothetical protein
MPRRDFGQGRHDAAQSGMARGQRVRKTQPDGGSMGEGMSPLSSIRSRFRPGSGIGTADRSAFV